MSEQVERKRERDGPETWWERTRGVEEEEGGEMASVPAGNGVFFDMKHSQLLRM